MAEVLSKQQMISLEVLKKHSSTLQNHIDLRILGPELQGRPVLSPFLKSRESSIVDSETIQELLEFVFKSGQQAVDALIGALRAEKTHPGHAKVIELLEQPLSITSSPVSSEELIKVLYECKPEIEANLDVISSNLLPTLLQNHMISNRTFQNLQSQYLQQNKRIEKLLEDVISSGVEGIITFIITLQQQEQVPRHQYVAEHIIKKIQEHIEKNPESISQEHISMLNKSGILSISSAPSSVVVKNRIMVVISMETYYDSTNLNEKLHLKLYDGKPVSVMRNELCCVFEEFGFTIINITHELMKNKCVGQTCEDFVKECFEKNVGCICDKNTVVLLCILGRAYAIKDVGMCLLWSDRVTIKHKFQDYITEKQLIVGLKSLPTHYITILADCYWDTDTNYYQLHEAEKPWQHLCPWDSRNVIFTTRPVMGKTTIQEYGHLSHIFIHVVKNWKHRGEPDNITHYNISDAIALQFRDDLMIQPCILGDVDRQFLGYKNIPSPIHFIGEVTDDRVTLGCGSLMGFRQNESVYIYHLTQPEILFNGVVNNVDKLTCTVCVCEEDMKQWKDTFQDAKNVQEKGVLYVSVCRVLECEEGFKIYINMKNTESEEELLSYIKHSGVIVGISDTADIQVKQHDEHKFQVIDKSIRLNRVVSSIELVKSMINIIACNKYIRNIKSFPLEEMYYSCYMYPEQAKPLLSKEKNGKEFGLSTNSDNSSGTIDNALCDLGEESGWTPSVPQSILGITFKTNHLLTAVEVRGVKDGWIPHHYNIFCRPKISMSPERFEGPKKSCRLKTCDINFINEMGADTMILAPLTIREFDFSKKYFFCFRLLQKLHNDVTHVEEISLDYNQYPGYEFSPPPNQEGTISLTTNGWLTVMCPISPQYPLNFAIKRNLKLTQFQTKIPDELLDSQDIIPVQMFELRFFQQFPRQPNLIIQTPSIWPERRRFIEPVLCSEVVISPVFVHIPNYICLQVQLFGNTNMYEIDAYDGELIHLDLYNNRACPVYVLILCVEDTGGVSIISNDILFAKRESGVSSHYLKQIQTFLPQGLCEVQDLYKVIVSTVPLRLNSIQQGGCIEYFSLHHYDNKDVVTQQVSNVEDWYCYDYKVTVKKRGGSN